jgi:hypothetical protein
MSCNVAQYLPSGDDRVDEVERIVHLNMKLKEGGRRGRGTQFLPPQNIQFIVKTEQGDLLHLTGYCLYDFGECYLDLQRGREIFRKFHAHEGHENPAGRNGVVAFTHMHFPSVSYPLVERESSYAYSIDGDRYYDIGDCLTSFCVELNIDMAGWQPYLR